MLNLNDIIALAKQGYKPADIKELIELSKSEGPAPEGEKPEDDQKKEQPKEKPEDDQKKEPQEAEKPEDDTVDYKKKAEELEKKLSEVQKANTKQNADKSEEKSDAEMFADVMKSFM